jgi:hypothetical protein
MAPTLDGTGPAEYDDFQTLSGLCTSNHHVLVGVSDDDLDEYVRCALAGNRRRKPMRQPSSSHYFI